MPFLTRQNESGGFAPCTWAFWRNLAVCFCAFSVLGHWIEIPYCMFMRLFGIYDPDSLVWGDPMYPFIVYGVGAVVFTLAFVPLKDKIIEHRENLASASALFLVATILICMVMELVMGLILNQPNAAGEYPLWDNSQLPLNILGQAWLVNDILLGCLATLYTWLIYPVCEWIIARIPARGMNVASVVIVVAFVILCVVKFT